jgi:hypothetical protein
MIVTAWKGGNSNRQSSGGYGLKVAIKDRDRYFSKDWKSVVLYLGDHLTIAKANIDKLSFWNDTCHELISKDIGLWLIDNGLAPWPKGKPPPIFYGTYLRSPFSCLSNKAWSYKGN